MLTFDTALQASLDTATDKLGWSNTIVTALGANRTLRCKVSNSSADPWTTGTEFLNVAMTGTMNVTAGNLTSFGVASGTSIQLAADLNTGFGVLRIEGNGHFMQGTLGLTGSNCDFTIPSNPTTQTGIGFTSNTTVQAPRLLSSGTGPVVPELTANAPKTIELQDWSNPDTPTTVGTLAFDTRIDDFVFEDAEMATEMGDIGIYQSSQSIIFGEFEFGAQLFVGNPSITEANTEPLYQVVIGCKPHGTWATYPAMDTFNSATNNTFPSPFKVVIKNAAGDVLYTHQMRDGLPINSPSLPQGTVDTDGNYVGPWDETHALRPFFNCGMLLPWQNTRTRRSNNASKFFNGVVEETYRPSCAKQGDTVLQVFPMFSTFSANSLAHLFGMPEWGMPADYNYGDLPAVQAIDPQTDSYLFDRSTYHNYGGKPVRLHGWNWEPGATCGHDWYTGPGGPRFDRAVAPSVLSLWASDQSFVRLQGNVPIRDMVDAWGLAYFNHSNHWLTNVKTFSTVPDDESLAGEWVFANAYYGGGPYTNGPGKTIDLRGPGSSSTVTLPNLDSNNRMPWCGWMRDALHSYCQSGWWALMLNSPMHAFASKFDFNTEWMGSLGASAATTDPKGYFMIRVHAWRYLHYIMAWKLASRHPLGYTRQEIEDRFQAELEALYDAIYKPAFVDNSSDVYFVAIRNLGETVELTSDGTALKVQGGPLGYYMSHCLMLMKQTGLWSVMLAKSTKCDAALRMIIRNFDLYSIDWILDTDGRGENGGYQNVSQTQTAGYTFTAADVPASWADWNTQNPPTGQEDWIRDSSGTILAGSYEKDVAQHLRAQWPFMRRDYFPEIPNARLDDACAKYQGYFDAVTAQVNAAATPTDKRNADWHYRYPSLGVLKAQP